MKLAILVALPVVLCAACQNNTIVLDFDTDSTDEGTAGTTATTRGEGRDDGPDDDGPDDDDPDDSDTEEPLPGIAGNWLLAASTVLDPRLPFQFFVVAEEVGPDLFNLTMTSLSLDIGSTTAPRQLVGDQRIYFGVPLAPGAGFDIFTGPITIPGAANPITGGDVSVDILLTGMPAGNPYCGVITGNVTAPVTQDVSGSTFGTEKVTDVGSLPQTFATGC